MTPFQIIITFTFLFAAFYIVILISLRDLFKIKSEFSELVNISVVTAAHNEERCIGALIEAAALQEYPSSKFEVIIVDDNSTDSTYETAEISAQGKGNIEVVKLPAGKRGKKDALEFGISKAKYDNIMITDADCLPARGWLKAFAGKFADGGEFIIGIAPFRFTGSLVNKISCFENLRNSILTLSFYIAGMPYSAAARSLGFTKKLFESAGGYLKTRATLGGDDDLLLREAVNVGAKILTVTNTEAFVFSSTKESLSAYFSQKSRHVKTSFNYNMPAKIILALWHTVNLIMLFSPLLWFVSPLFALMAFIKLIVDVAAARVYQNRFGYKFNLINVLMLQIIYEITIIINFFNAAFRKDKW